MHVLPANMNARCVIFFRYAIGWISERTGCLMIRQNQCLLENQIDGKACPFARKKGTLYVNVFVAIKWSVFSFGWVDP